MREFIDERFLLPSRAARRLYRGYAEGMPIYDYHCHLPVKDIAENRRFDNLTQAWLAGDHYKWRAMRANGVGERLITGDARDPEKFEAWAATVPATIGNPLYHWTHLELARYFGVHGRLLGPRTAAEIYAACTEKLRSDGFRARGLLERMNVRVVCTTDDPTDSLEHHAVLRADRGFAITVVPAFRPDASMGIEHPAAFNAWVDKLATAAGISIGDYDAFLQALRLRHGFFHDQGCRVSDHGIEEPFAEEYTEEGIRKLFLQARAGGAPSAGEARAFKSAVLVELGRMDAEKGWAWQLHMSALRSVNSRARASLGPDTGYDMIGDFAVARSLARLLDRLEAEGRLPKTILYSLNPAHNAVLASIIGCFQDGGVPGKMQLGSAWWFNDQKEGMEEQMMSLANMGLLARFIGMLTDSRSFLSFPRHEYFRRILCGLLGERMERGEVPLDFDLVGGIVRDICWNNAAAYFAVPLKEPVPVP
jgi:glucuronate isomerase